MDIDQARTFLAVVRHGSFVAASEELHVTQTAVSARIQRLEAQLDTRLFVRDKSGARPTAAGERFVRYATALISVWDDARQQVALPPGRAEIARVGGEPVQCRAGWMRLTGRMTGTPIGTAAVIRETQGFELELVLAGGYRCPRSANRVLRASTGITVANRSVG